MTYSTQSPNHRPAHILVMGAGSIGCFVGGCLALSGAKVTFVGRKRIVDAMRTQGLRMTDLEGLDQHLNADRIQAFEEIPTDIQPDLVLLTVKSSGTVAAATQLHAQLPARTLVLSLQNGVTNAQIASQAAPNLKVFPGMVAYNVAQRDTNWFHRGTAGEIWIPQDDKLEFLISLFKKAGLGYRISSDMESVLWGKLIINLNNPVNAASGLPLREELLTRSYRLCLSELMQEALHVCSQAGIRPSKVSASPVKLLPYILQLPNWLFRVVAAKLLRIDDQARSSMADDLASGRITEIQELCGAVVKLAHRTGIAAPVNQRMIELIENKQKELPMSGEDLLRFLRKK